MWKINAHTFVIRSLEWNYIIRTPILLFFCSMLESVEQRLNIEQCTISISFGLFELVSCSFLVISISKSFRLEFNIFRSLQRQSDVQFDVYFFSLSRSLFLFRNKRKIPAHTVPKDDEHYSVYVKNWNFRVEIVAEVEMVQEFIVNTCGKFD